ncbi:MAG: hypothetical protein P8078_10520, partial [bacterium]
MKKQSIILVLLLCFLIFVIIACDEFSTSVEPLIDEVEDYRLTSESQVDFLINGIHARFTDTYDYTGVLSGILADECIFDRRVPNATYPTFEELDDGDILLDNNSVDNLFEFLGELRFFADNLLERIGDIDFSDETLENKAYFYSNFYGGVARYFYATYFGLDETTGGGVINAGPFIPSADMYDLAVTKLTTALDYADASQAKLVNTLLARIYLYQNEYTDAATYAANGLIEGDAPYQALY